MNLSHRMTSCITVASPVSRDTYGKPTYGPRRELRARIEKQQRLIRNATSDDAQSTHRLYVSEPISRGDRVWLPGTDVENVGESFAVLAVNDATALASGWRLYEVDL